MNVLNPFTILSCGVKPNLVTRYNKKVGKKFIFLYLNIINQMNQMNKMNKMNKMNGITCGIGLSTIPIEMVPILSKEVNFVNFFFMSPSKTKFNFKI